MAIVLVYHLSEFSTFDRFKEKNTTVAAAGTLEDQWAPFARLTIVIIGRSVIFYGLNTFIPLYWIHVLHQSKTAGATALTIWAGSAVIGSLIGGRLADRFGHRKIILSAFCILIPFLPALIWTRTVFWAILLLVPIGAALAASYSPAVITGQRYLPNHIGFSSGITLGVAVAVGGMAAPVLGKIADIHGIWWALAAIAFLPALSAAMALTLPQPKR
jgi:FSR family fosmidomycin resistance protein-like MFS transporter